MFDLTSIQNAIENCQYPELVEEPVILALNFTFHLENVIEFILLGERTSSVADDNNFVVRKKSKIDKVSLEQIVNSIPQLMYRYLGSCRSDYVPILPNESFAITNTQLSNLQG